MTKEETRRDKLLLATIKRSDDWPKLRRQYLKNFDRCAVCGARKRLVAHHIIPYHIEPEKELDAKNLITLCESHHLTFGHLQRWASYNINVVTDAEGWGVKIKDRPKWKQIA
jgi:5-methylcytosine-specific restriction endonuclease McrA